MDDDGESVNLSFGTLPDEVSPGTQSTATVNLTDNDHPQVTAEFGAATYTATEGGSAVTVTVNLSADPERSVTIPITAAGADGATAGDYTLSANSVTIPSGRHLRHLHRHRHRRQRGRRRRERLSEPSARCPTG